MSIYDKTDRKILSALDTNSRCSLSELARKVKLGRDLVDYRLERLFESGVLKRCSALIDPSALNLTAYRVSLQLVNDVPAVQRFTNHIRKHPHTSWWAECDGSYDLLFSLVATSPAQFTKVLQAILCEWNDLVLGMDVCVISGFKAFHKNFLLGKGTAGVTIGEAPLSFSLDQSDSVLLRELTRNARIDLTQLADLTRLAASTIKNRIDRLVKRGVIACFRTELDLSTIDMMLFKTQVHLRNYKTKQIAALEAYCANHPYITYFVRQIGSIPVELEVNALSYDHYADIINELRATHASTVRNCETFLIRKSSHEWRS